MTGETTGGKDYKFIINTITDWNEPPRARHQVTLALARKYRVVYIASNKIGFPELKYITHNENILVIQPYFIYDFRIRYRLPVLNELYQLWLFKKLKRKFPGVDVINFDFTAYLIHRFFRRVYYYCNDNFSSISRKLNIWPIYSYHSFCERKLAGNAKFCVGTSAIITESLKKMNANSYEIPLGGPDIDEFGLEPLLKPSKTGPIHIGLVGFIRNYNLSLKLINDILSQLDADITMIGPVEQEFYDNIIDKDRIKRMGILKDMPLLREVNKFDVAIAPYVDQKYSEGGIPNKLFIYLAMGKPAVVTELLSLKKMNLPENLVYLVKEEKDFPGIIKQAHLENNEKFIRQRIDFARLNTWDIRMKQFIKLVEIN